MSFQEKSTWIVLLAVAGVYGAYFALIWRLIQVLPVEQIIYQGPLALTVVALVVLMILAFILVFVFAPKTLDTSDERDRAINREGEYIGSYILGVTILGNIGLAAFGVHQFWIANGLLLGLVLAELIAGAVKVTLYRRGALPGV